MAAQLQKPADEMIRKKLLVDSSKAELNNFITVSSKGASPPYDAKSSASSIGDFAGYGRFVGDIGADTVDRQYPVIQADNGSYVYLMPGFQTGYFPYCPVSTAGIDGQYVGENVYSPGTAFQPPIGSPGYYSASLPYGELFPSPYSWDSSLTTQDGSQENGYDELGGKASSKPNLSNPLEVKSFMLDVPSGHDKYNQEKPVNQGCLPIAKFPTYNQGKSGFLFQNDFLNVKANRKGWVSTEKIKLRSKLNGSLNEQNQGLRTAKAKGALMSGGNGDNKIRTDQYNLPDFPTKYDHAHFFVIKSYSEDDIHKSIKYNVWTSTPNGNKRLDSACQEAQKMAEKGRMWPVFLFFSFDFRSMLVVNSVE